MSLKSCFHHLPRRFGHVSRYRQGQAVVVGLAKPQSVAYAAPVALQMAGGRALR